MDAELRSILVTAEAATTCVIVDPPAVGLTEATRAALLEHPVGTLVYVSCHPATLARDLAALASRFSVRSVTPLDMFPQTAEIECVAHLQSAERTVKPRTGSPSER